VKKASGMADTDLQITICGSAGDGTIAVGEIMRTAMARAGYRVIAFDVYPPEIRGFGKCIARSRISTEPVYSLKPKTDILVSLNDHHSLAHIEEVREDGVVIREKSPLRPAPEGEQIDEYIRPRHLSYGLDMRLLSNAATNSARSRNLVVLGFLAGLYELPKKAFLDTLSTKFARKGKAMLASATAAFEAGFKDGQSIFKVDFIGLTEPKKLPAKTTGQAHETRVLTGNAAIAQGCIDAKIDTFFGYPITPATTILERLSAEMPKHGGRILQTEDEISAMAAVLGAGYAGSRTATATSGPGLSLMVEMLGLGIMGEIPAVVIVSQRGGPSTGLPTKTEQSDLNLAVYGGSGDAPRIVIAPTNVGECYEFAGRAFELAEIYQVPVILLLDLYLSNRYESVTIPKKNPFRQQVGKRLSRRTAQPYQRYQMEDDNISARAIPGQKDGVHTITGLEHDEMGKPCGSQVMHAQMSKKRHDKLKSAVEYPGLSATERFGDEGKVDVGVLTWGSTFGEVLEAMRLARADGIRVAALKVAMPSPFPTCAVDAFFADCAEVLVPETNYEGQLAMLTTAQTGHRLHRLNQATGVPMHIEHIHKEIHVLAGKDGSKAPRTN
jgi:2-oxoglutarate ferredoxin oxidoreductase subunit alpha